MHTGLSRPNATRWLALFCASAFAFLALPGIAGAQTTQERIAATREKIDAAAERWFAAQAKAGELDAQITHLEHEIAEAEARVDSARSVARERTLMLYHGASVQYASVIGTSVLDSARRARLIDHANDENNDTLEELDASLEDLHGKVKELEQARDDQADAVASVSDERAALDGQLDGLRAQLRREAARTGARRPVRTVSPAETSEAAPAAATAPAPTPAPAPAVTPTAPPATGGTHPHHDDPFLVCTRARESGGNYSIVSADGRYYGAYQFLPSTWDTTAAHAGRDELIDVLPSRASAYDQDDMAWTLYQWQGKGPWGGRC
jgi:peptidoglycan hydrolase CwlO-like protein